MRCVNDKSMNNKIKNITQECTEIRSRTMLELPGSVCECVSALMLAIFSIGISASINRSKNRRKIKLLITRQSHEK